MSRLVHTIAIPADKKSEGQKQTFFFFPRQKEVHVLGRRISKMYF